MSLWLLALLMSAGAVAQAPPAASPASRAAVANRRAVFTLIGSNFRPLAQMLRQDAGLLPADAGRYAARVSFLADLLPDAFPDISSVGDTHARAEVWSKRADFDRRLREFHDHTAQLAQAVARHDNETVRTAVGVVAQDCKSCHESYRSE